MIELIPAESALCSGIDEEPASLHEPDTALRTEWDARSRWAAFDILLKPG